MNSLITNGDAHEAMAWQWLLNLPRFDWKEVANPRGVHGYHQCSVTMHPGALHSTQGGAPIVVVHVSHPALPAVRFRALGNSLFEAVETIQGDLWRAGVETPFVGMAG